ncbi:magnesium transporter [Vulcanimicrobium alpinum]|uniref:Magnesium transporter n=1 Tax=Vulcanimicrobium alpinum TaxID=3016050 RepID=A0AAN1XXC7_UNVUL|nr:CBS domain-containing protein [Vulcanimicrobium alpinum]BDE07126.1 magnesium transporter [Vulcanimicrobium alpinum]
MPFHEGFVSELVGRSAIVERGGSRDVVGRVADFVVEHPEDTFPRIDAVIVKTRHGELAAPIADVASFDDGGIVLTKAPTVVRPPDDEALYLIEDLFDKQIVDVDGRKVVRINDIEIARTAGALRVVAADIGVGGLLRRLGIAKIMPRVVDRVPRSLIAWDNVAPLRDLSPTQIRLSVSEKRLSRLHPTELAEILGDLSAQDAARVVGSLDDERAADALEHLEPDVQRSIIDDLGTARAADIIEEMDSDDAADLLGELPEDRQNELLAEMDAQTADDLRELVAYADDTAGGLMTTDYFWIYPHRTVTATIAKIREIAPETEFIYYLYVLDQSEKLLGVLSLRTLLLAEPNATIHSIMDEEVVSVRPDVSAEDVASTIARYDLLACPVTDDRGTMLGIVTVDDAIDAIIPERLTRKLPRLTKRGQQRRAETVG